MIWRYLRRPWLAPLLEQAPLCRGLMLAAAILGAAHLAGITLFACPFSTITGLPCAGCGITRATAAWLRGDWRLALHYHPLSPGVLAFGVLLLLGAIASPHWRAKLAGGVLKMERATSLPTLFLIVFLGYGFLRMGGVCPGGVEVKPSPFIKLLEKRREAGDSPMSGQSTSSHYDPL